MFNLSVVKMILESEFSVDLVNNNDKHDGYLYFNSKTDEPLYIYGRYYAHDKTIYVAIRAINGGQGSMELHHFSITDENQLRKWIADMKKVIEFYKNI